MRTKTMVLKFFILALVLYINCHLSDAKASLAESSNQELFPPNDFHTGGHNIAKRGLFGSVAAAATTAPVAKPDSKLSDVKIITKLIFQKLKENFKLARADSKGKSWAYFLKALIGAATSAVRGAIAEFFAMKMREKFTSLAGGALGSFTSFG